MTKFKVLDDWMLLELVEEQKSSLVLPEDAKDERRKEAAAFKVLDSGEGYWELGKFIKNPVKVGDKILVAGYSLTILPFLGEKIILARGRDVALYLREEKDAGV